MIIPSQALKIRLAKYIATSSILSRRQAEKAIEQKRVTVNKTLVSHMTCFVSSHDQVHLDGILLQSPERPRLWKCYKPRGCLVTRVDPFQRSTIYTVLNAPLPKTQRFLYVGRLDFDSEGLLLMTNTPILAHNLENPQYGWERYYRIEMQGIVPWTLCKLLNNPITYKGIRYPGCQIQDYVTTSYSTWITIILKEGKKREIRNRVQALGVKILRLIRTQFATIMLGTLQPKFWQEVPKHYWPALLLRNM
ncbi:pseudouridine synthase [Holospora curviuscula]|uniref:Dual-specificity RNA pseudouridine synthase RluF n=1 Tax=Holospora curviuscula TaxID=1082868 RepID=A0A2S5R8Z4_9PROT|nr:pseudouridine synthase [Holospora curviuscula]PPE03770.1 Ribosomal large subunit pseudouridine synthase B [Holospora curviuscula]